MARSDTVDPTPKTIANATRLADLIVGLGYTHQRAADEMSVSLRTVERWLMLPCYAEAVAALVAQRSSQHLVMVAWDCLLQAAAAGGRTGVAASKEILARLDRPIPTEITGNLITNIVITGFTDPPKDPNV